MKIGRTLFIAPLSLCLLAGLSYAAWSSRSSKAAPTGPVTPQYDPNTGKLAELLWDSKGTGKVDTWSYMDGTRFKRIEIDRNGDGKPDRWEYYGEQNKLEKIGFSRLGDGKQDAWAYLASEGVLSHIDISTHQDGKINRVEYYTANSLARVEEDVTGDGTMDTWETYEGGRLAGHGKLAPTPFPSKATGNIR